MSGTVVDSEGGGLPGLRVGLARWPDLSGDVRRFRGGDQVGTELADEVRTDRTGRFRLTAPAAGPWRLEIEAHQEATTAALAYFPLLPFGQPTVLGPIRLPGARTVEVRVVGSSGEPVAGAVVGVVPSGRTGPAPPPPEETRQFLEARFGSIAGRTDEGGVVEFVVPDGDLFLAVAAPGYGLALRRTENRRVLLRLAQQPMLMFKVLDDRLAPEADVLVRVRGVAVPFWKTNENGEVAVNLADGDIVYEFEAPGRSIAQWSGRSAAEPQNTDQLVEIRLAPPVDLVGRVTDTATGDAVPEASVFLSSRPDVATRSGGLGGFSLPVPADLADGVLVVTKRGYAYSAEVRLGDIAQIERVGLTIGLVPAAPRSGFVADASGRPVVGAEVFATPRGTPVASLRVKETRRVSTGGDGEFWLADLRYGLAYDLRVEAEGFAASSRSLPPLFLGGPVSDPLRIVLSRGGRVRGRLLGADGTPVVGAAVRLLLRESTNVVPRSSSADSAPAVRSNADGTFEVQYVPPGRHSLLVSHADWSDLLVNAVETGGDGGVTDLGLLTMDAGLHIAGIVVDARSRPIPGATVEVNQLLSADEARTGTTDAAGRFRLAGLLPELAELAVRAAGYAPTALGGLRPGSEETIRVELEDAASVEGRLVDPGGNPSLAGTVAIEALEKTTTWLLAADQFLVTQTDDEGRFRFPDVRPGRWSVSGWNETGRAVPVGFEVAAGESREIEVRLAVGAELWIETTDETGLPLPGVEIWIRDDEGTLGGYGRTDASGTAAIAVHPGEVLVTAQHAMRPEQSRRIMVDVGRHELRIEMGSGWAIEGSVFSTEGYPLAGAKVEAIGAEPPGARSSGRRSRRLPAVGARTASDTNGHFRLNGLLPGDYRIAARLDGYSEGAEQVTIADRSVGGVYLVLDVGATLHGRVTGIGPNEMGQVLITAARGATTASAAPDGDGRFDLRNLATGSWRLSARVKGSDRYSLPVAVQIEDTGSPPPVELVFEPGFLLGGQVVVQGAPLASIFVIATPDEVGVARSVRTDRRGRFLFLGLPQGSYRLDVLHAGGDAAARVELRADTEGLLIDLPPSADWNPRPPR